MNFKGYLAIYICEKSTTEVVLFVREVFDREHRLLGDAIIQVH